MIRHQELAAGAELFTQVRAEILPELRTRGAAAVRQLRPDASTGGFEHACVAVVFFHFL
jgi:hypothetical protein